jgi:hypothetical protein
MYYLSRDEEDSGKLFQGDIFEAIPCPYLQEVTPLIFREQGEELVSAPEEEVMGAWESDELILVRARKLKVILLSQTCDIHEEKKRRLYLDPQENYDNHFILYAPLLPIEELQNYPRLRTNLKKLRDQALPSAFWLPADEERGIEESVVYFHLVAAIVKRRDNRFRSFDPKRRFGSLRPPYREALATKFAHMISRVALPSDFVFEDNRPTNVTA